MFKSAVLTLIVLLTCLNVSPAFAQSSESKVDMKISGEIHHGLLYYDDGDNPDFRRVDNDNDPTLFRFEGITTEPIAGWFLGGLSELEFADNSSAKVTQTDDISDPGDFTDSFKIRKAELFFSHPKYGVLSFGRGATPPRNRIFQGPSRRPMRASRRWAVRSFSPTKPGRPLRGSDKPGVQRSGRPGPAEPDSL